MVRRRCVHRCPNLRAKEGLSSRTQLHRSSKAVLKVGAAALEQEVKRELRPPGELLAARVDHQGGQVSNTGHNLPDLRPGGVQGPADFDAILN